MIKIYPKMPKGKYILKKGDNDIFNILYLLRALGAETKIDADKDFVPNCENKNFIEFLKKAGLKKNEDFRYNAQAKGFKLDLKKFKSVYLEAAVLFSVLGGNGELRGIGCLDEDEKKLLFYLVGNLKSMGAKIEISGDFVSFCGVQALCGTKVNAYSNSRILGILLAASSRCEGAVVIKGYNAKDKKTGDVLNILKSVDVGAEVSEFSKNKNIVLTGMSGCGKTAVGTILAKMAEMKFVDTDEVFVAEEKKEISKVFEEKGEAYFRKREAEIIKRVSAEKGLVVSTGGGAVLSAENVENLKKNGIIIYLKRDIEKIISKADPSVRPLFGGGAKKVKKLFESRKAVYEATADYTAENNSSPEEAAKKICEIYRSVTK